MWLHQPYPLDRRIKQGMFVTAVSGYPYPVRQEELAIVAGTPLELLAHVVPQFPSFSEVWLDLLDV